MKRLLAIGLLITTAACTTTRTPVAEMTTETTASSPHTLTGFYGNTFNFVAADASDTKTLHINEDGTFELRQFLKGNIFVGVWNIDGEEICFSVGDDSSCFHDLHDRSLGETWTGEHHENDIYTASITKGRVTFSASTF